MNQPPGDRGRSVRQAFIDESVIEPSVLAGVYVIAAAVVVDAADELRSLVIATLNRKRPFHWMDDQGPVVRERLLRLIVEMEIHAVVAYENLEGPRTQEPARRRLLHDEVLPRLHGREVGHIVFEQRGGQDQHDKRTMAEFRADAVVAVRWSYEWAGKSEPLLWIADVIAGAAMEHVVGRNSRWWAMLATSGRAQLIAKNDDAPSSQA